MLRCKVDGVSSNERISKATLDTIKTFARSRPTVYLPTHDPQSRSRLANRRLVLIQIALPRKQRNNHIKMHLAKARRHNVRYWHKADMPSAPHMSAFGGKADMAYCTANVRL